MSANMIDKMTNGAMSSGIAGVQAELAMIRLLLERIASQTAPAPTSHPDAAPQRWVLSSTNPNARWLTSGAVTLIGILAGGDTSGRGVLQINADSAIGLPLWLAAGITKYVDLTHTRIELTAGTEVVWIPPGGTTWDVVLFYVLREPQGRKAK